MIKYLGGHIIGFLLLLMLALTPKPAQAQADTSQFVETDGLVASPLKEKTWAPNPQKAVYLALIPGLGLGQWYNHKYWKTPIVYIGYASLIYGIIYTSGKYHDYKRAYVSIADGDANSNYWTKFIPNGQDETSVDTGWLTQALQSRYIRFRRYRDYCILGTVAFYGLTILDAYVDAQLFDFDIAPNLSLHLQPQFDLLSANPQSTLGMQCTLTF